MNQLTFQSTALTAISHNNQTYLTSSDLARALGYARTDSVSRIYERNQDEFTTDMTTTVKLTVVRETGSVDMDNRIFSLRGAHLIAMFARTPVAKEFRKWVLDILDKEAQDPQPSLPLEQPKADVVLPHKQAEHLAKYIVRAKAFAKEVEVFHRKLHQDLGIPRYIRNDLAAKGYDLAHEFNYFIDPFINEVMPQLKQQPQIR